MISPTSLIRLPAAQPSRATLEIDLVVALGESKAATISSDLLAACYEASRHITVGILLNGHTRGRVDDAFDPIVEAAGVGVRGVAYLDTLEGCCVVGEAALAAIAGKITAETAAVLRAAAVHAHERGAAGDLAVEPSTYVHV